MSVEAMALVLHHSRATGTAKVVLLGIANHAGDGGAWPTIATLARYANVTERAVQTAIRQLQQLGELVVHQQEGGTSNLHSWQRPNRYDVLVGCPITCDHTAQHRERQLPTAPADLWTEGVKPASPGEADDTRGVKPASPGGVKPASPKPSLEPTSTHRGTYGDQSAREARHLATCSICSLPYDQCMIRERTSGHSYTPRELTGTAAVAKVLAQYDDLAGAS